LEYIVHISRGSDNVDSAASLGLAADDDVVLAIKLPSGALKTFVRNDF
jgi:hypothetical protein